MSEKINIVWFKRDLRLSDHRPLKNAIEAGLPLLLLVIYEPKGIAHGDNSPRHRQFLRESVLEMNRKLVPFDTKVIEVGGDPSDIFHELLGKYSVSTVFSHKETGVEWTFARDLAVKRIFTEGGVEWQEEDFSGIRRGLRDRREWSANWTAFVKSPPDKPDLRSLRAFALDTEFVEKFPPPAFEPSTNFQTGGTTEAVKLIDAFVERRGANYLSSIGKPAESAITCARISPYLAWGNVSVRQVYRMTEQLSNVKNVAAFRSRLAWRDHFIQRFEMDMSIETAPLNVLAAQLERPERPELVEAWKKGETGFPLIDAAMRAVAVTGWLNFRLRASVVSFLTHLLWSDWRAGALHLAANFLDYEPGIHYSQFMMQSGESGFHTIRVYNPTKQASENDPRGEYIRRWLPELANLPENLIFEPWRADAATTAKTGFKPGRDYPLPIIDYDAAYRHAVKRLWEWKESPDTKAEAESLLAIHSDPEAKQFRSRRNK